MADSEREPASWPGWDTSTGSPYRDHTPDSTPTPVEGGWPVLARDIRNLADAVFSSRLYWRRAPMYDLRKAARCVDMSETLHTLARAIERLPSDTGQPDAQELVDRWKALKPAAGVMIRPGGYD